MIPKFTRNCMDGYLTEGCNSCVYWKDTDRAIGCQAPYPISECKFFSDREKHDNTPGYMLYIQSRSNGRFYIATDANTGRICSTNDIFHPDISYIELDKNAVEGFWDIYSHYIIFTTCRKVISNGIDIDHVGVVCYHINPMDSHDHIQKECKCLYKF